MRVLPFAKTMYNDNMITFVSQAPWVPSSTIPGYYRLDLEKKILCESHDLYLRVESSRDNRIKPDFFVDVRERNLRAESNGANMYGRLGRFFLNPEILMNKRS